MRRTILWTLLLIAGVSALLLIVSAWVQPLLPPPWNGWLLWLGVVIPAAIIVLDALGGVVALVEKLTGRSPTPAGSDQIQALVAEYAALNPAANRPALEEQVRGYLGWVSEEYGWVQLAGIKRKGEQVMRLSLTEIYVPLEATVPAEVPAGGRLEPSQTRTIALSEVLTLGPRLVIVGGPGSGKTTVLLHLAWTLAEALRHNDPALAQKRLGWSDDRLPLPIFIPLSAYADYRRQLDTASPPGPAQAKTLIAFLSHYLIERQTSFGLPPDFVIQLWQRGQRLLLLLDGLDEVPDETYRVLTRQAVEDVVTGRQEEMRVVVTCRSSAYQGPTALGQAFREVRVRPLSEEQVHQLVQQAYRHVYRHDVGQQKAQTQELLDSLDQLEAARRARLGEGAERLVTTPLLVRLLLIVHYGDRRRLPQQRAELYLKAVDALLLPDQHPDAVVAQRLGQLVGGSRERHRDLVQHLAYHLHRQGEQQGREIEAGALRALLRNEPLFAPLVEDFIAVTHLRSGVVEERAGRYRFIHLAFQEFLTARYMAEVVRGEAGVEGMARLLENGLLRQSWWREPILLIGGYLNVTSAPTAQLFVRRLAGLTNPHRPALSPADSLAATELAAASLLEWPVSDDTLRRDLADDLSARLEDTATLGAAPAALRAQSGVALGQLGERRPALTTLAGLRFAWVPAGPFIMGSDDPAVRFEFQEFGEAVQPDKHPQEVPYSYWLGQLPITNAQFAAFVQAGGYAHAPYWEEAAAQGLWRAGHGYYWTGQGAEAEWAVAPHDYSLPFHLPAHPVVGVSWYEALAFCRWLQEQGRAAGWWPAGWRVQLPSEAEWEKGTRGGLQLPQPPVLRSADEGLTEPAVTAWWNNTQPRRAYPWGDDFSPDHANTRATGLQATAWAGCFPQPGSPYGCQELSGNVWEWTRSLWGHFDAEKGRFDAIFRYPYQATAEREAAGADSWHPRVVRGGSWVSDADWARCAFRRWRDPNRRNDVIGFRVVVSPFTAGL